MTTMRLRYYPRQRVEEILRQECPFEALGTIRIRIRELERRDPLNYLLLLVLLGDLAIFAAAIYWVLFR